MCSASDFLSVENKIKDENKQGRRYYDRGHSVLQYRHNLAVTLPPEVEDRFSLVPGLDIAHFSIEENRVIITFSRKGVEI